MEQVDIKAVADEILNRVIQKKESKTAPRPQHVNRASSIGHPCERYLVLSRTHWHERKPHSAALQDRFDDGSWLETKEIRDLQDAGIEVEERQTSYVLEEYNITGHIDGVIHWPGLGEIVLEVKTISQFHFDKINSIYDFFNNPYYRSYPAQILAYLKMAKKRYGMILMKCYGNASGFPKKFIPVDAEDENLKEYFEQILERIKRVNKHVEDGTLPEIDVDYSICRQCSFSRICFPDKKDGDLISIHESEEVEEAIRTYIELKDTVREYEKANKIIKGFLKGIEQDKVFVGEFVIETTLVKKDGYTVNVPPSEYRRIKKIVKIA